MGAMLKKENQRACGAAKEEVEWRFGAVDFNSLVDLSAGPLRSHPSWKDKIGRLPRHVDFFQRSVDEIAPPRADLEFDSRFRSVAGGWMQTKVGGERRTIVTRALHGRSTPAFVHFLSGTGSWQ